MKEIYAEKIIDCIETTFESDISCCKKQMSNEELKINQRRTQKYKMINVAMMRNNATAV